MVAGGRIRASERLAGGSLFDEGTRGWDERTDIERSSVVGGKCRSRVLLFFRSHTRINTVQGTTL